MAEQRMRELGRDDMTRVAWLAERLRRGDVPEVDESLVMRDVIASSRLAGVDCGRGLSPGASGDPVPEPRAT